MKKSNVAVAVRELLESRPYLTDAMREDIINYSALARKIFPDVKTRTDRCSQEAVIIAIQRFAETLKKETVSTRIVSVLAKSSLSLKSDITDISLKRTHHAFTIIYSALNDVDWSGGEVLYIVQGHVELSVITDNTIAERLKGDLRSEIVFYQPDLNALSIKSPVIGAETPGLYYYLFGILAKDGMNVVDVVSTPREIIFILNKSDAAKAYELLSSAVAKCRKGKQKQNPNKKPNKP